MAVKYVTKQAILEEAGLSQPVLGELVSGTVNGTNNVFSVSRKPLADANYDDAIDPYDVTLFVNGSPVGVASVDEAAGTIATLVAPANGTTVTADYRYSAVLDQYVDDVRDEAQDWIDSVMDAVDPLPYADGMVPPTIRKIARVYAAGMLLSKDYGYQRDTDGTSKDGMARMKQAEAWLDKYVLIGGSTGLSNVSSAAMEVHNDGTLFEGSSTPYISIDDRFMRDAGSQHWD